jgi:hypothetical protein
LYPSLDLIEQKSSLCGTEDCATMFDSSIQHPKLGKIGT